MGCLSLGTTVSHSSPGTISVKCWTKRLACLMKQFSSTEIVSAVAALPAVVVESSRVFCAVDSAVLQIAHRCTPAPHRMPAASAALPTFADRLFEVLWPLADQRVLVHWNVVAIKHDEHDRSNVKNDFCKEFGQCVLTENIFHSTQLFPQRSDSFDAGDIAQLRWSFDHNCSHQWCMLDADVSCQCFECTLRSCLKTKTHTFICSLMSDHSQLGSDAVQRTPD